jgi:hypothetical protein
MNRDFLIFIGVFAPLIGGLLGHPLTMLLGILIGGICLYKAMV